MGRRGDWGALRKVVPLGKELLLPPLALGPTRQCQGGKKRSRCWGGNGSDEGFGWGLKSSVETPRARSKTSSRHEQALQHTPATSKRHHHRASSRAGARQRRAFWQAGLTMLQMLHISHTTQPTVPAGFTSSVHIAGFTSPASPRRLHLIGVITIRIRFRPLVKLSSPGGRRALTWLDADRTPPDPWALRARLRHPAARDAVVYYFAKQSRYII